MELLDEGGGDSPVSTKVDDDLEVREAVEVVLCQGPELDVAWPKKLSPWYWKKQTNESSMAEPGNRSRATSRSNLSRIDIMSKYVNHLGIIMHFYL